MSAAEMIAVQEVLENASSEERAAWDSYLVAVLMGMDHRIAMQDRVPIALHMAGRLLYERHIRFGRRE